MSAELLRAFGPDPEDDDEQGSSMNADPGPEIERLQLVYNGKFSELCRMLSVQYGRGDFEELSEADRQKLEAEGEELLENWDMADVESVDGSGIVVDTPLQKLLSEVHEIGVEIMNLRDAGMGDAD